MRKVANRVVPKVDELGIASVACDRPVPTTTDRSCVVNAIVPGRAAL